MSATEDNGFIEFALAQGVLKFGAFELKSGRTSPYFFNAGLFRDGAALSRLGAYYADLTGRVIIVDDVITAGTAIRESIDLITEAGGQVAGVIVAIDRQERGQQGSQSAIQEVQAEFKVPVYSLVCFDEIIAYVRGSGAEVDLPSMLAYRDRYGAA